MCCAFEIVYSLDFEVPLFDPLDEDGLIFPLNLHATPCACLIDGNVRIVFVKIGVVVLGLLTNLPIVQLENRFATPAFNVSADCELNCGRAATTVTQCRGLATGGRTDGSFKRLRGRTGKSTQSVRRH